jgi:hypothetical protein
MPKKLKVNKKFFQSKKWEKQTQEELVLPEKIQCLVLKVDQDHQKKMIFIYLETTNCK